MKSTSRHWSHRLLAILLVAATVSPLVVGVSVMEGCKKKAPPPPPPPPQGPPPPPPEVPVDFKAVAQTMKADRRVAVAPGVKTTKEPLAEAIITLADGLARGDDKKFGGLIDPASRNQLKGMVASKAWQEQTKKIESVRVVRIIDGAESAMTESAAPIGNDIKEEMLKLFLQTLPDASKEELKTELGHEPTTADVEKIIEIVKGKLDSMIDTGVLTEAQAKVLEERLSTFEKLKPKDEPKAEPKAESAGDSGAFTVTLAVQEPGVAYVLGWIAVEVNGQWTFKASSAAQQPNQRRASDFDVLFNTDSGGAPAESETPAATGG
jgi:hypothetical protein